MMNGYDVESALQSLTVIVDTREQDTPQARKRYADINLPVVRQKLNFGDYSAFVAVDNEIISFENQFAIERKMSLDELCQCFCSGRKRFEREFMRAKEVGAKLYLLIEDNGIDKAIKGVYRSQMNPNALIGSIFTWLARYGCQLIFVSAENSGRIIREIIKKEVETRLMNDE